MNLKSFNPDNYTASMLSRFRGVVTTDQVRKTFYPTKCVRKKNKFVFHFTFEFDRQRFLKTFELFTDKGAFLTMNVLSVSNKTLRFVFDLNFIEEPVI